MQRLAHGLCVLLWVALCFSEGWAGVSTWLDSFWRQASANFKKTKIDFMSLFESLVRWCTEYIETSGALHWESHALYTEVKFDVIEGIDFESDGMRNTPGLHSAAVAQYPKHNSPYFFPMSHFHSLVIPIRMDALGSASWDFVQVEYLVWSTDGSRATYPAGMFLCSRLHLPILSANPCLDLPSFICLSHPRQIFKQIIFPARREVSKKTMNVAFCS